MPLLNDVQSRLNAAPMLGVARPKTPQEVAAVILDARERGIAVCPAGCLHSMGGQQFKKGGISLSSAGLNGVGPLERESKSVWAQSGVTWPQLAQWLHAEQCGEPRQLTFIQKQTGADNLSLGGAVSSNIHGRVLGRRPIVADIQAFCLTTPDGQRLRCSRQENPDLFRLAVGGYGLFGFIDSIQLKLEERRLLARRVREIPLGEVIPALEAETRRGAAYGDFQYKTDESARDFMAVGIMSTYAPTDKPAPPTGGQSGLSTEDWTRLYLLAHTDKARAYREYAAHYFQTDGQRYWSDDHQFSPYLPDAGDLLHRKLGWRTYASLMISELYVPRPRLVEFMSWAKAAVLRTGANLVYGTIRLIESESETFLPWASQNYACVIFNLLVEHSPDGIRRGQAQFRALIDCALAEGGSYYLTYHRWAAKDQVRQAYPRFAEFLQRKRERDPQQVFSSDWYTHHRAMFS